MKARTAYQKRWYKANKEKIRLDGKSYYQANRKRILRYQFELRNRNPLKFMLDQARRRAQKHNWKFSVTADDLGIIPTHCPIFNVKLTYKRDGSGKIPANLATIDRINSKKGYVKGNVQIISWRANDLKKNITMKEMKQLGLYYRKVSK